MKAINYFRKKVHLRCSTGSYLRLRTKILRRVLLQIVCLLRRRNFWSVFLWSGWFWRFSKLAEVIFFEVYSKQDNGHKKLSIWIKHLPPIIISLLLLPAILLWIIVSNTVIIEAFPQISVSSEKDIFNTRLKWTPLNLKWRINFPIHSFYLCSTIQ